MTPQPARASGNAIQKPRKNPRPSSAWGADTTGGVADTTADAAFSDRLRRAAARNEPANVAVNVPMTPPDTLTRPIPAEPTGSASVRRRRRFRNPQFAVIRAPVRRSLRAGLPREHV